MPVNYAGYSYFILAFELIGSSNTVLQGLYLLRRKEYQYGGCWIRAILLANVETTATLSEANHRNICVTPE